MQQALVELVEFGARARRDHSNRSLHLNVFDFPHVVIAKPLSLCAACRVSAARQLIQAQAELSLRKPTRSQGDFSQRGGRKLTDVEVIGESRADGFDMVSG